MQDSHLAAIYSFGFCTAVRVSWYIIIFCYFLVNKDEYYTFNDFGTFRLPSTYKNCEYLPQSKKLSGALQRRVVFFMD